VTALAVPPCPSCQAGPEDVIWTGGSPPDGGDSWRCSACGYAWTTPGTGAKRVSAPVTKRLSVTSQSYDEKRRLAQIIGDARAALADDAYPRGEAGYAARAGRLEALLSMLADSAEVFTPYAAKVVEQIPPPSAGKDPS
jgi:rubredoxin